MNKADKLFVMIVAVCACLLYVPLIWSAYRDAGREKEVVVSYKDREILRKSLSLNDVYTVKGTLGDVQVEINVFVWKRKTVPIIFVPFRGGWRMPIVRLCVCPTISSYKLKQAMCEMMMWTR